MSKMIENAIRAAIVVTPTATKNADPVQNWKKESRTNQYMRSLCSQLGKTLFGSDVDTRKTKWNDYATKSPLLGMGIWIYNGVEANVGSMLNRTKINLDFMFKEGTVGYIMAGYRFTVSNKNVSMEVNEFTDGIQNNKVLIPAVIRNFEKIKAKYNIETGNGQTAADHFTMLLMRVKKILGSNWGCLWELKKQDHGTFVTTGGDYMKDGDKTFEIVRKLSGYDYSMMPAPNSSLAIALADIASGAATIDIIGVAPQPILNKRGAAVSLDEALGGLTVDSVKITKVTSKVSGSSIKVTLDVVAN
ncbi:hypothetical protein [Yersinia ruckeri]|uniref:hypothetical protein n=1 Tax=Yersinia ruckeri TaxID=29486 RepID=UPI00223756DB|nr:hypothetical protein [Yersinia ruckeri]MCW6598762.1 hypothetical protein [Yersinia ruckeri]